MNTTTTRNKNLFRIFSIFSVALTALLATAPTAAAAPGAFTIHSKGSSRVTFESDAPIENIVGVTTAVTGTLRVDLAAPERGASAEVTVDLTKVKTGIDKRDEHMRSADFLDTKRFPTTTFKLTKIELAGPLTAGARVEATGHGELTIKGKSVKVKVPVQLAYRKLDDALRRLKFTGDVLRATTRFDIQLSDYGIKVPGMLGQKVSNTVTISVALTAVAN